MDTIMDLVNRYHSATTSDKAFVYKDLIAIEIERLQIRAEKAEAECESLCANAERYRWLRDIGDETWVPMGKRPGVQFTYQIDAAIDAAMKESK